MLTHSSCKLSSCGNSNYLSSRVQLIQLIQIKLSTVAYLMQLIQLCSLCNFYPKLPILSNLFELSNSNIHQTFGLPRGNLITRGCCLTKSVFGFMERSDSHHHWMGLWCRPVPWVRPQRAILLKRAELDVKVNVGVSRWPRLLKENFVVNKRVLVYCFSKFVIYYF